MGPIWWKARLAVMLIGMASFFANVTHAQQVGDSLENEVTSDRNLTATSSRTLGVPNSLSQIDTALEQLPSSAQPSGTKKLEDDDDQSEVRNDPFGLSGIAQTAPQVKAGPPGFRPAETRPTRLPEMTLRGIGRMDGNDSPTALLEIGNFGLFVVTENDTISLQGLSGDNVMRIVDINDISVTVEAGSFGELIVVR